MPDLTWKQRGLLSGMLLGLVASIAGTTYWIALGGPIGRSCATCQTSLGERSVSVSSDRLLNNISLVSDGRSARIDLEGTPIVVEGNHVQIGATTVAIPSACKALEILRSYHRIRVLGDGVSLGEIHR